MVRMRAGTLLISLPVVLFLMAGCGAEDETDGLAWGGTTPHLTVKGSLKSKLELDGTYEMENIDLRLQGADASDLTKFSCEREWDVPLVDTKPDYAHGKMVEIKLVLPQVTVGSETRSLEIEFKRHDFQKDKVGSIVKIVPRIDGTDPAADSMWFEWEWVYPNEAEYEQSASAGQFTLNEFTGKVDETGLIIPGNTGTVGGVLNARWSPTENLEVSFTAKCGENDD
ncbi:MAG: hypothetical protein HY698_17135 [Deltaproteobacteria bacterium]|nr:hypothetical protein [Deltaproteobacteria bacterium]